MQGDTNPERRTLPGFAARRPAVPAAGLFIVGVLVHPLLPPWPVIWLTAGVLLLAAAWSGIGGTRACSALLAGALTLAGLTAAQLESHHYPRGHVSAFAADEPRLARLELHVDYPPRVLAAPFAPHHPIPPRQVATASVVRVKTWDGWARGSGKILVQIAEPHPRLAVNQTVRVIGMLQRPAPANNPGQFDWADYYREQRTLASVRVGKAENVEILDSPGPSVVASLRERTRNLLAAGFPADRALDHALLRALLLGDSDPQLRDVQEQFQRTGTGHHLAISGMHVAVLGGLVFWVCRLLCLSPRKSVAAMTGFVVVYGVVALPSPPVVRSVLLCLAVGVGLVGRRSLDMLQLLALSVLGMLVYHPLDLYNAGFQLSFGTVLGLILFTKPMVEFFKGKPDPDAEALRGLEGVGPVRAAIDWLDRTLTAALAAGVVAWAVSMPLIAYHFEQLNPWAVFAGIALSPAVFAALLGGLLKVVLTLLWPGAGGAWAALAAGPVALMRHMVDLLALLPASEVPLPAPPFWLIAAYYLLMLSALRPCPRPTLRWCLRGLRVAAFGMILLLPFQAGLTAPRTGPGKLRVTLLAVGAGQCAVIEPPSGRTVLLDAGSTSLSDLVHKCLGPFLRRRGHTRVDTVVISHGDYDHFSAAAEVVEAYGAREVLTSAAFAGLARDNPPAEALLASLDRLHRPPRLLAPGDRTPLGRDTALEVLWPPKNPPGADEIGRSAIERNDASLVLRLTHAGRSILFPGDVQDGAMRELLKNPEALRADVLVAPHHGSAEALTAQFIAAVAPSFIVSSNDRTLTRKQREFDSAAAGRPLYRTHRCGAIMLTLGPDGGVEVETFLAPSPAESGAAARDPVSRDSH